MTTQNPPEFHLSDGQRAQAATMGDIALDVAENLAQFSMGDGSNQTLHVYEDERITIQRSRRHNSLTALVKMDDDAITVYFADADNRADPHIFRPGAWMDYMYVLGEKTTLTRAENEKKTAQYRAANHDELYSPIDDAALFELADSPPKE